MPTLQVRELPEPVHSELVCAARMAHRSLAQQAIATLEKGLGIAGCERERRLKILREIESDPVVETGQKLPDPIGYVRQDRER